MREVNSERKRCQTRKKLWQIVIPDKGLKKILKITSPAVRLRNKDLGFMFLKPMIIHTLGHLLKCNQIPRPGSDAKMSA
jgi:hypothetical protein